MASEHEGVEHVRYVTEHLFAVGGAILGYVFVALSVVFVVQEKILRPYGTRPNGKFRVAQLVVGVCYAGAVFSPILLIEYLVWMDVYPTWGFVGTVLGLVGGAWLFVWACYGFPDGTARFFTPTTWERVAQAGIAINGNDGEELYFPARDTEVVYLVPSREVADEMLRSFWPTVETLGLQPIYFPLGDTLNLMTFCLTTIPIVASARQVFRWLSDEKASVRSSWVWLTVFSPLIHIVFDRALIFSREWRHEDRPRDRRSPWDIFNTPRSRKNADWTLGTLVFVTTAGAFLWFAFVVADDNGRSLSFVADYGAVLCFTLATLVPYLLSLWRRSGTWPASARKTERDHLHLVESHIGSGSSAGAASNSGDLTTNDPHILY